MKYLFGTIDDVNCVDLDEILKNMLEANEAIKNDLMSEAEIIEYVKGILATAHTTANTGNYLFWGFDDPRRMDGDSRVYYFYNPTYYNIIFLVSAYLRMPAKLESIEGFMDIFSRGLSGSTCRAFKGHGFDAMSDFRKIMKKFIEADVDIFVERYPNISERFTEQFVAATSYIRDIAEMYKPKSISHYEDYKELNDSSYRIGAPKWEKCWVNSEFDAGIRDVVIKLNQKGYYTTGCCEGHTDKVAYEYTVCVYIAFEEKYNWAIEPPFIGETKGICCKERRNCLYWNTRRRVKFDSKEADRQQILASLNAWVDELPERED